MRPNPRRRARVVVAAVLALVALAGTAWTAGRVFGAAEVATEVVGSYPAAAPAAPPGVIGTFSAAPLIVDGRLRVYATTRQVRADAPVDARTQRSPFWSFRRWPEQLTGVVAVGTTVVSRWSDGALVGIDARTGRVAWRVGGPAPETTAYTGRRTGAASVYAPDGLFTAGPVVIARGAVEAVAVDTRSGRELWRRATAGRECRGADFTTVSGRYVMTSGCQAEKTVAAYDARTGREAEDPRLRGRTVEPLGCRLGRSECAGLRTDDTGWLLSDDRPTPAPALAAPGTRLVGDLAIRTEENRVVARDAATGADAWTWTAGPARVVAAGPDRVHLLTDDHWLATLDARTGVERARFLFTYGRERTGWTPGMAYADRGFLLVERLAPDADPLAPDDEYYFIAQPVLLAGA